MSKKQTLKDFIKSERKQEQKNRNQNAIRSRHSRFGGKIQLNDKKNNLKRVIPGMLDNFFPSNTDSSGANKNAPNAKSDSINPLFAKELGHRSGVKRKPKPKDQPEEMLIHYQRFGQTNITGSDEEENMKTILNNLVLEILESSFNPLFSNLLSMIHNIVDFEGQESNDKYMFIKLTSFFLSVGRLNAYRKLIEDSKQYKSSNRNANIPKPSLALPISKVTTALDMRTIDFIYSYGFKETICEVKSKVKLDNCLVSIEFLMEMLYFIRDMDKSNNETIKRNSSILKQKLFTLQLCDLVKFCFDNCNPVNQSRYFIHTLIRFLHTLITHLEEYSKDKILYIQQFKKERRGKNSSAEDVYREEEKALEHDDEYESSLYDEKRFSLPATLAEFVSYKTIDLIIGCLSNPELLDDELIQAIGSIFNRIVNQVRGAWIFYQLDTMNKFENFLFK